jgi:hypothetical protein
LNAITEIKRGVFAYFNAAMQQSAPTRELSANAHPVRPTAASSPNLEKEWRQCIGQNHHLMQLQEQQSGSPAKMQEVR